MWLKCFLRLWNKFKVGELQTSVGLGVGFDVGFLVVSFTVGRSVDNVGFVVGVVVDLVVGLTLGLALGFEVGLEVVAAFQKIQILNRIKQAECYYWWSMLISYQADEDHKNSEM